jgi:hypothetical protein
MRLSSLIATLRKKILTTRAVGLCVEGQTLLVAHVVKEGGAIRVEHCENLQTPLSEKKGLLVSGLDSDALVFRTSTLPLKGKRRVLAALPFQLEGLLPFPSDQLVAAVALRTKGYTSAAIHATSKTALHKALDALNAWGIAPDQMSCASAALARLAAWLFPAEPHCIVLHAKEQALHCVVIKDRCVMLSQSISLRARDAELERLAVFIKEKVSDSESLPWILLGNQDPGLLSACQTIFTTQPLSVVSADAHTHTLAIGYALDALGKDGIQFLQKEFTPQQTVKTQKRNGIIYAASCTVLFILFSLCSTLILNKKSRALSDKYQSYFQAEGQRYSALAIQEGLDKLELSLSKTKNTSPFFPTIPNVSEVLSWLSTHPTLTTAEGLVKEGIEIKEVRYQLVKFPTLDEPSLPYHAQVEIVFTAAIPRLARDFHEALLKGDAIVNGKKDLKWNAAGNQYSTAFELCKKI